MIFHTIQQIGAYAHPAGSLMYWRLTFPGGSLGVMLFQGAQMGFAFSRQFSDSLLFPSSCQAPLCFCWHYFCFFQTALLGTESFHSLACLHVILESLYCLIMRRKECNGFGQFQGLPDAFFKELSYWIECAILRKLLYNKSW